MEATIPSQDNQVESAVTTEVGEESIIQPTEKEAQSWFDQLCQAAGLQEAQQKALYDGWQQQQAKLEETYQTQTAEAISALKQEWGVAYEERLELARRGAHQVGISSEELGALEQAIGIKPALALFERLGAAVREPEPIISNPIQVPSDAGSAHNTIKQLMQQPAFVSAYLNGQAAANAQMQQLMQLAYNVTT